MSHSYENVIVVGGCFAGEKAPQKLSDGPSTFFTPNTIINYHRSTYRNETPSNHEGGLGQQAIYRRVLAYLLSFSLAYLRWGKETMQAKL